MTLLVDAFFTSEGCGHRHPSSIAINPRRSSTTKNKSLLDLWDEDYLERELWKVHQMPGATDVDYKAHLKQEELEFKELREAINSI